MFILYPGGRENGGHKKNGCGRGRGKSTMEPISNTSITPQADFNETNEIEGGIPNSHNKGREKGKQVVRPVLTLPISPTLTRSRSPDNTKDIDDRNSTSDDNDDDYVYGEGEIVDDDDNGSFNSASSTSTYTPMKRSIPRITDLLQLTDSEEEAGETGK